MPAHEQREADLSILQDRIGNSYPCTENSVTFHMHLRSLRDTLEKVTQPVGATGHAETVNAA